MIILGIETSCDETALALIETKMSENGRLECRVIESLVHSQAELHSAYGGVYPSLAKREHGRNLVPLLHKLLINSEQILKTIAANKEKIHLDDEKFKAAVAEFQKEIAPQNGELVEAFAHAEFLKDKPPIDRIAVTDGPGLEPALWVGINFAKMLSRIWNVPIIPVDHMEGHIVGSLLPMEIANGVWHELAELPLPALALLISGGHTELVKVEKLGNYEIIGQTLDDAVGEAFDKVARLLGLPYPGGPYLSELAEKARRENIVSSIRLPRPMIKSGNLSFSFAGLKTAVLYALKDSPIDSDAFDSRDSTPQTLETDETRGELIKSAVRRGKNSNASHIEAVSNLNDRSMKTPSSKLFSDKFKKGIAREFEDAVAETLEKKLRGAIEKTGARSVIVGGGVSANHVLRQRFASICNEYAIPLFLPSRHISGDNALMIAVAGALPHQKIIPDAKTPGSDSWDIRAQGTKRLGTREN